MMEIQKLKFNCDPVEGNSNTVNFSLSLENQSIIVQKIKQKNLVMAIEFST
jgi:hypothetical protein